MQYLDKAKHELAALAGRALGAASGGSASQALTVKCSRASAEQFWRRPEQLSQVFGGLAEVRPTAADRYEWAVRPPGAEAVTWESVLVAADDGLRFVDPDDPDLVQLELAFADAPQGAGTEMRISGRAPLPEQLTGAALFTVLYRARALLQTGEIPTLEHNPSARSRPAEEA
ncbi:hypothetical protein [Nocardia carnea]|uniref:hypothetical protein n=1 Tax=Nocardia carnea TaxID=37328 RepID=UPI002454D706|nr:hypothetical protein [Nocardia carnea]